MPRFGALGLRGRIVGALLFTTVATLGVAALALLGPLERELRKQALTTLTIDVKGAIKNFESIDLNNVQRDRSDQFALDRVAAALAAQTGGGEVRLFAYPQVQLTTYEPVLERPDSFADVNAVFQNVALHKKTTAVEGFGTIGGVDVARMAVPIPYHGVTYVLAVRKSIDEIRGAVGVVRTAFLTAAAAGLTLTLILGIALATTLLRRLRRLRQAALRVAHGGPMVEIPTDRARDEVGVLTRTFGIMQRRLQQQEEARRAFVATASHELRTPLTSLDGMLELLDDDLRGGDPDLEDARQLLGSARAQSRRLGRLAADLLDLSRLDAEVELRSEPVELGELSRAVLAEFELGTAERRITSALHDCDGPVWALGDPGSVARILRILVDNAVRASPEGSEVEVTLSGGDAVELRVRDHGPGVPWEERELIFERFQRGTGAGGTAGFGLGLAIGRELAERMGGQLVLEDNGRPGATFTLHLPAARAPEADAVAVG